MSREYFDIFNLGPKDMPKIPGIVARYSLHISKDARVFVKNDRCSLTKNEPLSITNLIISSRPHSSSLLNFQHGSQILFLSRKVIESGGCVSNAQT